MNDPQRDNLEREMASLTEWQGETGDVWREALRESKRAAAADTFAMRLRRNWRSVALAASLMLVAGVAVVATMQPFGGSTRYAVSYAPVESEPMPVWQAVPQSPPTGSDPSAAGSGRGGSAPDRPFPRRAPGVAEDFQGESSVTQPRQIIRTATIELEVDDVRATFIKVQHLVSMARGEFIDDSSLAGGEPRMLRGNLTLRVEAARLSLVLNELRELGAVVSEKIGGEDVTTQMVDLDARLRNERRIEEELLKLLDSRTDAPLGEVLEVRRQLDSVRLRIEQLSAQQQRLTRQVALATILVFLRPSDMKEPDPAASGMLDHLRDAFSGALKWGLTALIDSAAGLLGLIVGGLMWWLALALGGWLLWTRLIRPQPARAV